MIKRVSAFFTSIGLIALFGPLFGLGVRGTSSEDNTPLIGLTFLAIGLVIYLISLGFSKV